MTRIRAVATLAISRDGAAGLLNFRFFVDEADAVDEAELARFDPGPSLLERGHLATAGVAAHSETAGAHLIDKTQAHAQGGGELFDEQWFIRGDRCHNFEVLIRAFRG